MFLTGGLLRNFRFLRIAMVRSNATTKIAIALQKAYNFVLKMNPIGIVITALTALAGVLYLVNRRKKEAVKIEKGLTDSAKEDIANTQIRQAQANNLINTIKSQNISNEQRGRLIRKLNTEYKDLLPNLIDEKDSVEDISKAQKEMNKQMAKKIAMIAAQDEMAQATKDAVEAQKQFNKTLKLGDELAQKSQESFGRVLSAQDIENYKTAVGQLTPAQAALVQEIDFNNQMLGVHKTKLDEANAAVVVVSESVDALADAMANAGDETGGLDNEVDDLNTSLTKLGNISYDGMNESFHELEERLNNTSEASDEFDHSFRRAHDRAKILSAAIIETSRAFSEVFAASIREAFGELEKGRNTIRKV